jgi:hypothetical protein
MFSSVDESRDRLLATDAQAKAWYRATLQARELELPATARAGIAREKRRG